MAYEKGTELQLEFELAVTARIALEARIGPALAAEVKDAKTQEERTLLNRAMHVSRCRHCWLEPPRLTGVL